MFIKSRPHFLQLSKHITQKQFTPKWKELLDAEPSIEEVLFLQVSLSKILKTALAGKVIG